LHIKVDIIIVTPFILDRKGAVVKSGGPSALENFLSTDPGQEILRNHLDMTDHISLKRTSFSLSQFFNKRPLSFWIPKLAYYLAQSPHDNWVQFILKSNPNLLEVVFEKVILKSCTLFNVTPLQLAYSGKDNAMCETLVPFFEERYGINASRKEMQKQISAMKNHHKPFEFTPIIQAISNESFNHGHDAKTNKWLLSPATLAAIQTFRNDFDASQPKTIDKGMQFRWETLQELTDAYVNAAAEWEYDYKKCALFEDAAYAWILGYLPENGKQQCSQGIYYLQKDDPEPLRRMQNMRDGQEIDGALKQQSADFFLDGSCVDIIFGRVVRREPTNFPCLSALAAVAEQIRNFCRTKTLNWPSLSSNTVERKHQRV
jgi:hypothetical protein